MPRRVKPGNRRIGNPHADRRARSPGGSAIRNHPYHRNRPVVQANNAIDDVGVGGEAASPGRFADNGDCRLPRCMAIVFYQQPPQSWAVDALGSEEITGDSQPWRTGIGISETNVADVGPGGEMPNRTSLLVGSILGVTRGARFQSRTVLGGDGDERSRLFRDV